MPFKTTREALLVAQDEREVARLVLAAIGEVPQEELRRLPHECVIALAETDIHAAAVALLHCDLSLQGLAPEVAELVRQLALLYATASARLTQVQATR
ncbi:MAG TPA: hypothetical protein VN782_04270 [Usitatibacter sp.]|nr:hypothetical protein [Usitatibacter sp.]